jgi:hypothetical protein
MNEIGLVEIETVQPLFLDPYGLNRTTGSLILIDSVTNATVGAAMVCESLSARFADASPAATDIVDARIRRHGHRPAIFLLDWQREHAEHLEQVLDDRAFETVLVDHSEIASRARRTFYATLLRLGIVVLAWGEKPIQLKDKALLRELAGESYFEFSELRDEHRLSDILAVAEQLRLNRKAN